MSLTDDQYGTAVIDCYHVDKNGDTWTMAELVKRNQELEWEIEDLEDAVSEAQESCAVEWEKDCAMALRRICDWLEFERNPDGDTADDMAVWIMLYIEELKRKANDEYGDYVP